MGKKIQPYTLFVQEYARQHNMNVSAAFNAAGSTWASMSESEKQPYKRRATMINDGRKPQAVNLPIRRGDVAEESSRSEIYLKPTRERWTEEFVARCEGEHFLNQPIYLISFNVMCAVNDRDFIPNEIGLVKYSFRNGIEEEYHRFIDCGDIPMGYASVAYDHMEKTHKIPPDLAVPGNHDRVSYKQLADDLENMMKDDPNYKLYHGSQDTEGIIPLFTFPGKTEEELLVQIRSCLKTIGVKSEKQDFVQKFDVLDVTKLLWHCFKRAEQENVLPQTCFDRILSTLYDYTPNSRCDFHEEKDVNYCALAIAKKLAYSLTDNLLHFFNIEPTANHMVRIDQEDLDNEPAFEEPRAFRGAQRTRPIAQKVVSGLEPPSEINDHLKQPHASSILGRSEPTRQRSTGIGRGRPSQA